MENDYHYIPEDQLDNKYSYLEYWPKAPCPYETEEELVLDMVSYSMAILGVKYLLGEETPQVSDEFRDNAIGMAEMIGLYDRETNKVSLSHADIQQLYPQFR